MLRSVGVGAGGYIGRGFYSLRSSRAGAPRYIAAHPFYLFHPLPSVVQTFFDLAAQHLFATYSADELAEEVLIVPTRRGYCTCKPVCAPPCPPGR